MFWECSLSFNIVQPPTPLPLPTLSFSFYPSLSQEWCLSLRLCAPAMSTPTLSCTWTWARTPGSSRGRTPRSESAARLGTKTHTAPFIRHFSGLNVTSLSHSHLLFPELVPVFVSAQLPGPFGSVGHGLLRGLGEYLMAEVDRMFMCKRDAFLGPD